MNDYDDLYEYDIYFNSYDSNIIENINVSRIFDHFDEDEEEEDAQRMSIEAINLTYQIINEQISQTNDEQINLYFSNAAMEMKLLKHVQFVLMMS